MEVSGHQSLSALPPWKEAPVPTGKEAGWILELVWTWWWEKNLFLALLGIKPKSSSL